MVIIWIGICVAALILELVTPTALISIWFAVGAAVSAIVALMHAPLWSQIALFAIVSIVSMVIVRPIATKYLRGNTVATNADRCIGSIGIVTSGITRDTWGEVKVNGSVWHAVSVDNEQIDVNEEVKVVAIEGAKLLVKRVS